jgi:hypothetical protein
MQRVYGLDKVSEISNKLSLPSWWIESVLVEHFECRRFAEDGELWTFDFTRITGKNLDDISRIKVVIPHYFLLQNVRPQDIARRMTLLMVGAPVIPLDEADLIPEGLVNNTAFPSPMRNDISVWDPKLAFHQTAIVYDGGIFYQWRVAEMDKILGSNSGWFKSDLFELKDLYYIYQKLQAYRNSGELKNPNSKLRESIANDYQKLELVRQPLRRKILEYHAEHKDNYDIELAKVPDPPRLSLFEAVKLTKEGYYVKTHMEPLFLRSAIRNLQRARAARKKMVQTPDDEEALLDEIEYSAMCIISATNCLESYINYIIAKYLEKESTVFDDTSSHRQKWLWVPLALSIPFKFKVDEPPFSDFSNLVKWRNNIIHHIAAYNRVRGPISHTANQFNLENAELSLRVVIKMISKLCENSVIPLPQWLRDDIGSVDYWNEVSSFLKGV